MKIVRIITRLNVGGPARHVVWLTRRFNEAGDRSVLLSGNVPPGEEDMHYFAEKNAVEPIYLKGLSRELAARDALVVIDVFRYLLRERPDVVHTHTAKAGTVGRAAAFLYRWLTLSALIGRPRPVKVVHTFHGNVFRGYYGPGKTKLFKSIERLLSRTVTDRILVLADQQRYEINHEAKVGEAEQFRIVPLGIDLAEFEKARPPGSLRRTIGAAKDEVLVGFIGRLTEIKDVPLLLAAFCSYLQRPEDVKLRLVIIGDGSMRDNLERSARECGLDRVVTFLGNREDTAQLLSELDIVALTSLNEGTPLSLIEAMAAGKPVVSTVVGGVADLLGEVTGEGDGFRIHERGIGIHTRDPEHYANGLLHLASDMELRSRLASRAKEYVFEHHSLDRLERDLRSLYSELVNG